MAPASKPKKEKPKSKDSIPDAPGWLRVTTNLGNVFYTHPETKRSEWTVPDEIREAVLKMDAQASAEQQDETSVAGPSQAGPSQSPSVQPVEVEASPQRSSQAQSASPIADGKRKRIESARDKEEGIDAAELIGQSVGSVEEDDEDADSDGAASSAHPRGKRQKLESEGDQAERDGSDEDEDDADWQRQIAAEMAAEAAEGDAQSGPGQSIRSAQPPSAPPQPPLPSVPASFQAPPPPPGGYSGPPPAATPAPKLSLEEGRALFMHMLTSFNGTSSEINPMAPWDKELPKFVHKQEYSALSNLRDRQDAFNDWCKARLREKREQKRARPQASTNGSAAAGSPSDGGAPSAAEVYRKLLEDNVKSTRTRFEDFRRDFKKDRRFYAFGRDDREREKTFRSYLRDLGEVKRKAAELADQEFLQLLDRNLVDRRNTGEGRAWTASSDAELKEQVWRDAKKVNGMEKTETYEKVGSSSRRAELFVKWVRRSASGSSKDIPAPSTNGKEDTRSSSGESAADKQQRRERALREREEQSRRHQQEVQRANRKAFGEANREDAFIQFTELLVDNVRDPLTSWDEFARSQAGNARFDSHGLSFGKKQAMFEQHRESLIKKKRTQLDAVFLKYAPTLDAEGDVVVPLALDDADYERFRLGAFAVDLQKQRSGDQYQQSEEQAVRAEFDRWRRTREANARSEFEEMLRESAFVDFWGRIRSEVMQKEAQGEGQAGEEAAARAALAQNEGAGASEGIGATNMNGISNEDGAGDGPSLLDMASQVDLEEMHAVLRNDARYRAWKHKPELRDEWLREHLDSLDGRKLTPRQKTQSGFVAQRKT